LALALARELRPLFADGVWLAEFSAVAHPGLVPATVAAAVRLELGAGEVSAQRVAQALADRRLLLVLDTCEHVIAAAATMAEAAPSTCQCRLARCKRLAVGIGDLMATRAADFHPDLKCLGPGSSMLGGSDMIAAEVEQVIDLIVG